MQEHDAPHVNPTDGTSGNGSAAPGGTARNGHPLVPLGSSDNAGRLNGLSVPMRRSPSVVGRNRGGANGSFVTPRTAFNALRRWWKLALPLGLLVGAGVGVGVWWFWEPQYEASAWVVIQDETPYLLYPKRSGESQFVNTQKAIIRTPVVLTRVLADDAVGRLPEIQQKEDPQNWLREKLSIVAEGNSELFKISMIGPTAAGAATIVNTVVDKYFDYHAKEYESETETFLRLLDGEMRNRQQRVNRELEKVRALQKDVASKNAVEGGGDKIVLETPSAALREQLTELEVERALLEAELAAFDETLSAPATGFTDIDASVELDPTVQLLAADVAAAEDRLVKWERVVRPHREPRAYWDARKALDVKKQELSDARARARRLQAAASQSQHQAQRAQRREELAQQISAAQTKEKLIREKYSETIQNRGNTSDLEFQLQLATDDYERERDVLHQLADRATAIRTEMGAPNRVSLAMAATVPQKPVEASPLMKVSVGAAAGFLLPFALAILWEGFVRRVGDATQLHEADLTVVGEIATLPVRKMNIAQLENRNSGWSTSTFEESIDSLRTAMRLNVALQGLQVLAVASSMRQEGKTSLSAQLSVSFARTSHGRVLLIDADMRSPDQHRIFNLENTGGLAEVLDGELEAESAIVPTLDRNLDLLPAGKLRRSPHELASNGAFRGLIETLRDRYETIIIDTPPVLAAAEALAFASVADATVLCTMHNKSCRDQIVRAYERLQVVGANPLGIVLNGVPVSRYAYAYGGEYR